MSIRLIIAVKGSALSGNYGHAGIHGHIGGSAPKSMTPIPVAATRRPGTDFAESKLSKAEEYKLASKPAYAPSGKGWEKSKGDTYRKRVDNMESIVVRTPDGKYSAYVNDMSTGKGTLPRHGFITPDDAAADAEAIRTSLKNGIKEVNMNVDYIRRS